MNLRKSTIVLALVLLTLSSLLNYPLALSASQPNIQSLLGDFNNDGLKDLEFRVIKEGIGIPGVKINLFLGNSSGLPLITGETNNDGSLKFFDIPGGIYNWNSSDGSPSSGNIPVSTPELFLTESEAVAWQTIALHWIGESQDSGRAFFEEAVKICWL